jgi:hypothetical protein
MRDAVHDGTLSKRFTIIQRSIQYSIAQDKWTASGYKSSQVNDVIFQSSIIHISCPGSADLQSNE